MAKTLKDFLEGYLKVKSADEQKFIDKHVTAKNPDRNGNGDDVFKGSTKTIDRRKDRKGYNPGEDEKVYEALKGGQHKIDANHNGKVDAHDFKLLRKKKKVAEEAEQIDEISQMMARAARDKAGEEIAGHRKAIEKEWDKNKPNYGKVSDIQQQLLRRKRLTDKVTRKLAKEEAEQIDEISATTKDSYVKKAVKQLPGLSKKSGETADGARKYYNRKNTVRKIANEEVELEEKLTAKTPMGTYIKDFQKSDAPQFKGKSQDKRRVMAIAAKLSAERGGKPLRKEERLQNRINDLTETHQRTMMHVFEKLSEDNKSKFLEACDTPEGVEQMLDFAINNRGE